MNNATYPETYNDTAGCFTVVRIEEMSDGLKNMVSLFRRDHTVNLWLTDKEMDQLATLLREAHDTSYPLFKTEESTQ